MNKIDEMAGLIRERWIWTKEQSVENEKLLREELHAFVADLQKFYRVDDPKKSKERRLAERTAFVVLRNAVEERMVANSMLDDPEAHVGDELYPNEESVLAAGNDIMNHVENCLDVAEALLMEW